MSSTGLRTRNNQQASSGGLSRQATPSTTSSTFAETVPVQTTQNQQDVASVILNSEPTRTMAIPGASPALLRPLQSYSSNTLSLGNYSFAEGNAGFLREAGVHSTRPEIVCLMDFLPIFDEGTTDLNAAGKLLDIQLQARSLRKENILAILAKLRQDQQARTALSALEDQFVDQINLAEQKINSLFSSIVELDAARSSFDVKQISSTDPKFLSLKEFFTLKLGFSETVFNSFSNTKILYQLIYELNSALETFSSSLVGASRREYQEDTSPVNILTKTQKADFFSNLRSLSSPKNAASLISFRALNNSFPSDIDNRIKLLFCLLSKELLVSKGLGESQVFLANTFNITPTGNPFDDILGVVGANVLDQPRGIKSLAALMQATSQGSKILPFETKFISGGSTEYIPGPVYFIDQIVANNESFNIGPITKYANDFNQKFAEVKSAFNKLLNNAPGVLGAEDIYSSFGTIMIQATSGLIDSTGALDVRQAFAISVFAAAHQDRQLKQLLFQFLLLSFGLEEDNESYKTIFTQLITTDIKTISDISALSQQTAFQQTDELLQILSSNSSGRVSEMLNLVAIAIETRLFELFGAPTTTNSSSPRNAIEQATVDQLSLTATNNSLSEISPTQRRTLIGRGNVVEMLMNSVRFNFLAPNLFNLYNYFSGNVLSSATSRIYIEDGSGRTRLNFFSTSTLGYLIFDIFTSFVSKYTSSRFENTTASNSLQFISDFTVQNSLSLLYQAAALTPSATPVVPPSANASRLLTNGGDRITATSETVRAVLTELEQSFNNIVNGISSERLFVENILHMFELINHRLTITKENLTNFFVSNRQEFGSYFLGESQIKLSKHEQLKLKNAIIKNRSNTASSPLLDDLLLISPATKQAMQIMLSEKLYKNAPGGKIKLFSVGVPNGFMKGIYQSIDFASIDSKSFLNTNNNDLVKINVFKRNADIPELVYKPQSFIFDLSLFVSEILEQPSGGFATVATRQTVYTDYEVLTDITTSTGEAIINTSKYDRLSTKDKTALLTNHLSSELLGLYLRLLTGMNVSETTFTATAVPRVLDTQSKQNIAKLLETYVKNFPVNDSFTVQSLKNSSKKITQLVEQLDLTTITSNSLSVRPTSIQIGSVTLPPETLTFLQTFSGAEIFAGSKVTQEKFLAPKLFDRTFTIPVDTEGFEIDVEKTKSQQAGVDLFERKTFVDMVVEKNGKFTLPPKNQNQIVFDDYFITIEPMTKRISI